MTVCSNGSASDRLRIGGMAMENGVLYQTDRYWAMATRDDAGEIHITSGRKIGLGRNSPLKRLPLLRSLVNLAETALLLPRIRSEGGKLPLPTGSPKVIASTIVSVAGSIILRNPKRRLPPALEELLVSALALVPSLVALRDSEATRYHAAEHKSINAYESSGKPAGDVARSARSEHPRCGSNIVAPALALMTLGNIAARRALGKSSQAARIGVSFLSLSGAIELIQWASRNQGNSLARAFTSAGGGFQRMVTTAEPSEEQLAVSLASLKELLRLEGQWQSTAPS